MTLPNWKNKLYFGDNLDILREYVTSESVDLIYLDPPFNSNATYNVLFQEKSVKELCKNHYSDEQIHDWISIRIPEIYFPVIDKNIYFVAIEDSVIVGFGGAVPEEAWAIYVLPSHIKSGIGSMLLSHAIGIALVDNSKVIVVPTLNAVGFYGK